MSDLADLVQQRHQNYWEARAKAEGRPGWADKPPLTMASRFAGDDLWPLALDIDKYKRLLLTHGNLAKKPSTYWGTYKYPINKCERLGNTYLQIMWITHFGDTPIYEVTLRWAYAFDGQSIGNQALKLYDGQSVVRSVHLHAYAETGYEGHHFKDCDADESDIEWFSQVLEQYWPLVDIDSLDASPNQLPEHPNG